MRDLKSNKRVGAAKVNHVVKKKNLYVFTSRVNYGQSFTIYKEI